MLLWQPYNIKQKVHAEVWLLLSSMDCIYNFLADIFVDPKFLEFKLKVHIWRSSNFTFCYTMVNQNVSFVALVQ